MISKNNIHSGQVQVWQTGGGGGDRWIEWKCHDRQRKSPLNTEASSTSSDESFKTTLVCAQDRNEDGEERGGSSQHVGINLRADAKGELNLILVINLIIRGISFKL